MNQPDKLRRIKGGTFSEPWSIEKLQEKIDELPKTDEKKRVLFVGEASFLKTGFSTYWDNVIRRLENTGKYEIAEIGCILDPRALISMKNGKLTPISLVNVGDKVLTHSGQIKSVTHTFKTIKNTQAVKILRKNLGGETIEVTHNHPILAIKKENAYKYLSSKCFKGVDDIKYEWIPAGELKKDDFVAYGKESFKSKNINTIESEGIKVPLNDQSALLFGAFLSNGCAIKNKKLGINAISFCGNKNYKTIATQIANAISDLFNVKTPKIFYREKIGVWEIMVCNRNIARFFYTLFGTSCHDKFISDKLWNANKDWMIKLLASYFEQDGCINIDRNVLEAKTVSKLLSNRIMQLGHKNGVFINRKWCQCDANTSGGYYLLGCRGENGNVLIDNFVEKSGKLKNLSATEYIIKDNLIFTKITQIHKRNFNDYVYNLEVEDDNSYICNNFVVHNSYAKTSDPRAQSLPWKFYGVIPEDNDSVGIQEYKQHYREAQFGKLIMDNVLADFKPNIVAVLRDRWMDYFWADSAFRDRFHWIYMACVDSYPQKWEWLNTYGGVDTLLAYAHFGKRALEEQSKTDIARGLGIKPLKVDMVMQPGIDTKIYAPQDKTKVKQDFGIPPEIRFIGMVSRNQKRKLFPRLIESFRMFKDQNGWGESDPKKKKIKDIDNIKLLLHTCVQDVGFDIPEAIRREGLQKEVLFSYICAECGVCAVSPFAGHPTKCPKCGKVSMITPNTQIGYPDEQFAKLFNLMDVYVQGAIAGAAEMSIVNAKSAGVPTIVTNYAAMSEQGKNGGGALIKCDLETEAETMQWRAWFDRQDLVNKLTKIMKKPKILERLSNEARRCAVDYYNWDLTSKKWEYILDKTEVDKNAWDKKIDKLEMPEENLHKQQNLSDEEFVNKCYKEILHREPDNSGKRNWLGQLKKGVQRNKVEEYFRNITKKNNVAADLLDNTKPQNPIEAIAKSMDKDDTFRILYCMPETAGDVLISTAIITKLQDEYPDASIYFATKPQYFDIIKDNPYIHGVVEYHPELLNYRTPEHFGPSPGFVDMCFCPFIITQKIPHWIHSGNGKSLGVSYAHMCNLTMSNEEIEEEMCIDTDISIEIPDGEYITFHCKTTQDPKDYERWDEVIPNIKNMKIVQVGGKDEPLIDHKDVVDLRGKTTPQQLAHVIANAALHVGLDSFPSHIARAVGTPSVVLYGGTYAKQAGIENGVALEPENRGQCITSCHLEKCILKEKKIGDKCINSILPETILETIADRLGEEHVVPPKPLKLSAYCIIKDGEKYNFPYERCISAACGVVDEFIMVDGGSTDGTWENLNKLAENNKKLKIMQHQWDMDDPMLMGNEKTYARKQCDGDYLIQLDADEILVEPQEGQIRNLIKMNRNVPIFNIPGINLYGDNKTIRVERPFEKWRISKNDENIEHGVHGDAREFDAEKMQLTYNKKVSDSCEYIDKNTLKIMQNVSITPPQALQLHAAMVQMHEQGKEIPEKLKYEYVAMVTQVLTKMPHTLHLSWNDTNVKQQRGEFWDNTWHGKNSWTHNSSKDIKERVENSKDLLIKLEEKDMFDDGGANE